MKNRFSLLIALVLVTLAFVVVNVDVVRAQSVPVLTIDSAGTVGPTYAIPYGHFVSDTSGVVLHFKYGTNPANLTDSTVFVSQTLLSGNFSQTICCQLTPNTTYYFQLCGSNAIGSSQSSISSFVTGSMITVPPTVVTGNASNITQTTATISGDYVSTTASVTTKFKWGYASGSLINETPIVNHPAGSGTVTEDLSGLSANTTVYFQEIAANAAGSNSGFVKSFTTQAYQPATINTLNITNASQTSLTLNGSYVSETAIVLHFKYWTTEAQIFTTAPENHGVGSGTFTFDLTSLQPNTTYYVQAVGVNSGGTTPGPTKSENTLAYSIATVTTGAVANITQTGVILSGSYDTESPLTFKFKIGTSASNLSTVITVAVNQQGSATLTSAINNLQASTTYYYQSFGTNSGGPASGAILDFTTLAYGIPSASAVVTDTTANNASLSVNYDGSGSNVTGLQVFYWKTGGTSVLHLSSVNPGDQSGTRTFVIPNLAVSTPYTFMVKVTNIAGTFNSDEYSFTTNAVNLTTNAVILSVFSTGLHTAKISFVVNSNDPSTMAWARYGIGTLTNSSSIINCGSGNATFTIEVTGISPGSNYGFAILYMNSNLVIQSTDTITFIAPTGVEQNKLNENLITAYPNPFTNMFNIETDFEGDLLVFDIIGKLVLNGQVSRGVNSVARGNLKPGVYILKVFDENQKLKGTNRLVCE